MRLTAIVVVVGLVASAHAAPWRIEVPAGYTEVPGAADASLAQLRAQPGTIDVDAQVYLSADQTVQLTRVSWQVRLGAAPSRSTLISFDRGVTRGAAEQASRHLSDSRRFVGDQLIARSADDIAGRRAEARRMYSADTSGVVHVLMVICAGPADQLGPCRTAQQSMRLVPPNAAVLPATPPSGRDVAYQVGRTVGILLVVALLVLWIKKRVYLARRPSHRPPVA